MLLTNQYHSNNLQAFNKKLVTFDKSKERFGMVNKWVIWVRAGININTKCSTCNNIYSEGSSVSTKQIVLVCLHFTGVKLNICAFIFVKKNLFHEYSR